MTIANFVSTIVVPSNCTTSACLTSSGVTAARLWVPWNKSQEKKSTREYNPATWIAHISCFWLYALLFTKER